MITYRTTLYITKKSQKKSYIKLFQKSPSVCLIEK